MKHYMRFGIKIKIFCYHIQRARRKVVFSGFDYSINPVIGIYKEFYPNNSLKVKGVYCWFGFKVGQWYNYSEDGNLVSTDDFDEGFGYSMDEIFQYCKTNNIPLEKKEDGLKTTISKYVAPDQKRYWYIQYPENEMQSFMNIQIDGITGQVISRKEIPLPSHEENPDKR